MGQRLFFHARLREDVIIDDVGVDVGDTRGLKQLVLEAVRECGLNLSEAWIIEITDESGTIVLNVDISDTNR